MGDPDWRETFAIEDWERPKRPRLSFLKRMQPKGSGWIIFADHPSWSITWLRSLSIRKRSKPERKRLFRTYLLRNNNGSGQCDVAVFGVEFLYSWQQAMPWPPAPRCAICKSRLSVNDQTHCFQKGCRIPDKQDRRDIVKRWHRERTGADQ